MVSVVITHDSGTRATVSVALRSLGFQVLGVQAAEGGVALAQRLQPQLVILDLHPPDALPWPALADLRRLCPSTSVVVAGLPSTRVAVQAMRLGASDYVERPIDADRIVEAVRSVGRALTTASGSADRASVAHASARWAHVVLPVVDSPRDIATLHNWGQWVAVSPGAIRNWCSAIAVRPKDSLNFARLLRAIVLRQQRERSPHDLFDVADRRTMSRLLRLGHPTSQPCWPITLAQFFANQRWVRNEDALDEVRTGLEVRTSRGAAGAVPAAPHDAIAP